jgi:hypothetical protein
MTGDRLSLFRREKDTCAQSGIKRTYLTRHSIFVTLFCVVECEFLWGEVGRRRSNQLGVDASCCTGSGVGGPLGSMLMSLAVSFRAAMRRL